MICDQCDREANTLYDGGDAGWLCDECAAEEAEYNRRENGKAAARPFEVCKLGYGCSMTAPVIEHHTTVVRADNHHWKWRCTDRRACGRNRTWLAAFTAAFLHARHGDTR